MNPRSNVDPVELEKFASVAHRWWDPTSEFRPLHEMNPLRLAHIDRLVDGVSGKRVLDVGCGGGILAESMAARGAQVLGIDLSPKSLAVAKLHGIESGVAVDYREVSAEALADEMPGAFDLVTCMEMLEHVPQPEQSIAACARLVVPGGWVVFATINRNPKAYALAVLGAEYVLRLLPRGTHDYAKFLKPSEVIAYARSAGLEPADLCGMTYNPLSREFRLGRDVDVNYIVAFRRS